jgi:hypothetical protein
MFSSACYVDPSRSPSRRSGGGLGASNSSSIASHAAGGSDDRKEPALANDQAQIVRLLEALNEGDPVQILRRSLEHDALDWVERGLTYGADLGLTRRSPRRSCSRP